MESRTFLFPGMGATARMYDALCTSLPGVVACDWPKPAQGETFADLGESCISTYGITSQDIVAGCSMGGMVAAEMFVRLHARALILIGSCTHPAAVPLHRMAGFGSHLLPDRLLGFSARSLPGGVRLRSALLADPAFVRWSLRAFASWPGVTLPLGGRTYHIHGLLDPVIPVINVRPQRIVRSGGHLIAITHHRQVASFLARAIQDAHSAA